MRIGRWLLIVVYAALPLGLGAGCMLFEKPKEKGPSSSLNLGDSFDETMLIRGTNRLLGQVYVGIVSTTADASRETTSTAIREDALRWRIMATSRVDGIRTIEDPRLRFTALWTVVTQFRIAFTAGERRDRFGPVQKHFVDFAQRLEDEVLRLAYDSFPDRVIDAARPEIEQFARTTGISEWVDPAELGRRAAARGESPIGQILSIPLSPIAGLQGVGNTPEAINNFTAAAREMTQVVERFPERARWQMELFMLEAQSSGAVAGMLDEAAAIRKQAAELGQTAERIAKVAEGLPANVGMQTKEVLKTAEAMQPQLGENLRQADTLVHSVEAMAGRVEVAARAVEAAASESKALTVELNRPDPATRPSEEEKGDDLTAETVTVAAREVRAAAAEIRLLVADLGGPTSMPALERTTDRMDGLVWKITRNAAGLILLAFVCGVLWLIVARMLGRGGRPVRPQP